MRVVNGTKQNIAVIALMIATFLNPLGFDVCFKIILDWTGSYWLTTLCFYLASASFFGLYFWLSGKKPIKYLVNIVKSRFNKTK